MQRSDNYNVSSGGGANIRVDTTHRMEAYVPEGQYEGASGTLTTTQVVTVEKVPPVQPERTNDGNGCFDTYWRHPNHQERSVQSGFHFDSTYLKTLDGILRLTGIVAAVIGLIFIFIGFLAGAGGWYIFVGFWFIVYCIIFIVVGTCVPSIYFHRLIDAIVMFAYAVLWAISVFVNLITAAVNANVYLGISVIFGVICIAVCIITGLVSLMTYRSQGHENRFTTVLF